MKTFLWELPKLENYTMPVVTFDIEAEKIAGKFRWGSGERNGKRWKPFMVGFGTSLDNRVEIEVSCSFDEMALVELVDENLEFYASNTDGLVYQNTRNLFDERVMKGTFINARRLAAKLPGDWPVASLEGLNFRNVPSFQFPKIPRSEDINWWEYPSLARDDDFRIYAHCARDILENLLRIEGSPIDQYRGFWDDPEKFLKE